MAKIDTSGWKTFTVGELFEKLDLRFLPDRDFNKGLDISEVKSDEFNLPLVNAKHSNNGIMYYGRESEWESASMTIDIVADGAASTGDVYAQPQKTGVLYNAYLVKPKADCMTKNILFFLATVVQRCVKDHFGYDNKCTWDKVKLETVLLPADAFGEPDWDYMDEYMSAVIEESEESLERLRQADGEKRAVDVGDWKEFAIGELFKVVKGTRLTKANMIPGDIRFIGSSAMNNGCTAMVGNTENMLPANTITVCYNGSVGETFYQDQPFLASDDVNVLYPKFDMTKEIALFIAPLIKSVSARYNYVDKWKQEEMIAGAIKLPVDASGEPDWAYMDEYMSAVMNNVQADLSAISNI